MSEQIVQNNIESLREKSLPAEKIKIPVLAESMSKKEYRKALENAMAEVIAVKSEERVDKKRIDFVLANEILLKLHELEVIDEKSKQIEVLFNRHSAEKSLKEALDATINDTEDALFELFRGKVAIEKMLEIMKERFGEGLSYEQAANNAVAQRQLGNISEKSHKKEQANRLGTEAKKDIF